jgi:hypothetical protein
MKRLASTLLLCAAATSPVTAYAQHAMPAGHPGAEAPSEGPVPDQVVVDAALPVGTIHLDLVDATEQPLGNTPVVLDIDRNTVAQGESHDERALRTLPNGQAELTSLKIGSGITYRLRTEKDGATFASQPFLLKEEGGVRVRLHVYEVVHTLSEAHLLGQALVVLEVKQDTVRVTNIVRTLKMGATAFVAEGLSLSLPTGARAFNQEQSDSGIELREKDGKVAITGTFLPGQAQIIYAYTMPLESGPTLRLELPLMPRMVAAEVQVNSGPGMTLEVAGFGPSQSVKRRDGQRVLATQKELPQDSQQVLANLDSGALDIPKLELTIGGLPSSGNGPFVAAGLAVVALLAGGANVLKRGSKSEKTELRRELTEARDALLEELATLERAKDSGEVGPKSYERLRAALVDALARVLAKLDTP